MEFEELKELGTEETLRSILLQESITACLSLSEPRPACADALI